MRVRDNYILGAGISGLIYAYYNRDFTIISPDIGGKLNNKFFENIFYLHATPFTERLLEDLKLPIVKKTQLIKYVKSDKILTKLTIEDKKKFISKKLNDPEFDAKDLSLSTSDNFISVFEVSFQDILSRLREGVEVINETVIKITETEIITHDTRYKYDKLVSTISARAFWGMYYQQRTEELKSETITFLLCDKLPDCLSKEKFDLAYFVDADVKYTRISKRRRDQSDAFLYEFSGRLSQEDCVEHLPTGAAVLDFYHEIDGLIFSDSNNIPPNRVEFVGRFATWDHSFKQQDVIEKALSSFDMSNIWNMQKRFTSNFVDFNSLTETHQRESLTKDYFTAMIIELSEVMNEINYKQHKPKKTVDIDLLSEELIDAFKYFVNICLMWDITPQKFIELFEMKSKKVTERYEKQKQQ